MSKWEAHMFTAVLGSHNFLSSFPRIFHVMWIYTLKHGTWRTKYKFELILFLFYIYYHFKSFLRIMCSFWGRVLKNTRKTMTYYEILKVKGRHVYHYSILVLAHSRPKSIIHSVLMIQTILFIPNALILWLITLSI